MTDVWEWPRAWYRVTSSVFQLKKVALAAPHRWTGAASVYGPISQLWTAKLSLTAQDWDDQGQAMAAFLDRLGGQAGLMRIGDVARQIPLRDRASVAASEAWSDGSHFGDGTGWVSGLLPPTVSLDAAAAKGVTYIVVAGLPASEARVLRAGDLIELRAGGIATATPNLYTLVRDAPTDAAGRTGLEIRPPLRQGFAAGDMVVLSNPTSVFRLLDDDQGEAALTGRRLANMGFALVEAII
ncbi:MAG: hypothetical protein EPO23_03240 [Xanthobacteraceae bacterium]|nr:MAG: hypothetical protein EPO23_03240 [Xanthobacteraceae bacterium]